MQESYTLCFRVDSEYKEGELVVLEKGRNGDLQLVNVIYNIDDISELYETLTRREI